MAGSFKVLYSHFRTVRHASKEEVEHHLVSEPFGAKALRSGIEVEGVWIAEPQSSRSTIDLALANARQPRDVHPAMREPERGRKNEYIPYAPPREALEELDAVYRTPRWYREGLEEPARPPTIPPRSPKRNQSPADLTMMDRHRRSQAAETGQLTARKKHSLTIDTQRAQSEVSKTRRIENQTEFEPSSGRAPKKQGKERIKADSPSRSMSMPDVVPFKQFMASTGPPSPSSFSEVEQQEITKLLDYAYGDDKPKRRSGPYELEDTSPQRSPNVPERSPRRVSRDRTTQSSDSHKTSQVSPRRPSFEKVGSRDQILRGHNTGFEILKPGTHDKREGRSAPPISLHNYTRPRDESRGRKLQKRRNSVDSQASKRSDSTHKRQSSLSRLFSRLTRNDS